MRKFLLPSLILALALPAAAQRVDSKQSHYRILVVDRTIVDAEGIRRPAHADGKLGWVAIFNPGSTLCLVEYTGLKHQDHDSVRNDKDPRVRVFEKGLTPPGLFKAAAVLAGFSPQDSDKFLQKVFVVVR